MSAILSRYILRETLQTWLVVTLVLLAILLVNQFAAVLGDAAANKLPRDAILLLMGLTSVQYLTVLVPVGLFLSVMLAMGRLYNDSEMAAMMACGIGPRTLYRSLLPIAGGLAALVAWLAMVLAPGAVRQIEMLAAAAKREASLANVEAGRFITFGETDAVLYAEGIGRGGRLENVFVERRVDDRVEVIVASEAWQRSGPEEDSRLLVFLNGTRYEGMPGSLEFRVVEFAEHGIPVSLPAAAPPKAIPETKPFTALLGSADPQDRAELHWRIAVPLTLLTLVVLAVPLSRAEPRQGRFSGLATAVLVYIIYANLLGAGRQWLERGEVPGALGLWWVHALFLLVSALLLWRQDGALSRLRLRFALVRRAA